MCHCYNLFRIAWSEIVTSSATAEVNPYITSSIGTDVPELFVVGGESCMWTEQ